MDDRKLDQRSPDLPKPIDRILLQVLLTIIGAVVVFIITKALLKSDAHGEPGTLVLHILAGQ
jgi:hypothetical protein